jgi:hypothetical protein
MQTLYGLPVSDLLEGPGSILRGNIEFLAFCHDLILYQQKSGRLQINELTTSVAFVLRWWVIIPCRPACRTGWGPANAKTEGLLSWEKGTLRHSVTIIL